MWGDGVEDRFTLDILCILSLYVFDFTGVATTSLIPEMMKTDSPQGVMEHVMQITCIFSHLFF